MKIIFGFVAIIFLCSSTNDSILKLPENWLIAGSDPQNYQMGIDTIKGPNGSQVATIRSIVKKSKGFGTLMQQSFPGKYLGKRVKFSGKMKLNDVKGWAGFWMRIDKNDPYTILAFENMYKQNLNGTIDWATYSFELNIPDNSDMMSYGTLLSGTGQIWFDDIKIEIISDAKKDGTVPLDEPENLGFDK